MRGQSSGGNEKQHLVQSIHDEYDDLLYAYAFGLCRQFRVDASYADDLMQEFYYQVMYRFDTFRPQYDKVGVKYLCTCLKNNMITLKRKEKSVRRLEELFVQQLPKVDNLYNLCMEVYTEQFYDTLRRLLEDSDLEIMILYIEGYSYKEISDQTGINPGTIGTRIHRAKKILKKSLGGRGRTPSVKSFVRKLWDQEGH